jgi:hypothetical protein
MLQRMRIGAALLAAAARSRKHGHDILNFAEWLV